jgi:hypothetical protein
VDPARFEHLGSAHDEADVAALKAAAAQRVAAGQASLILGGDDEVFLQLVLARIIEPTSKADSLSGHRGNRPASERQVPHIPQDRHAWAYGFSSTYQPSLTRAR